MLLFLLLQVPGAVPPGVLAHYPDVALGHMGEQATVSGPVMSEQHQYHHDDKWHGDLSDDDFKKIRNLNRLGKTAF